MRDATFLLRLRPPPPSIEKCLTGSVDADFVLALPFHHGDLEPDTMSINTVGCAR